MAITREVTKMVTGIIGTFHSASTWDIATTGSTGNIIETCGTYYGQVVDRLELGANYGTVDVSLWLHNTVTSTESGNSTPLGLSLATWLQHGASSCGGDMAALSPPQTYACSNYFSTLDSTAMFKASTWGGQLTTGALNPGVGVTNTYDLNGASRYVRSAFVISRHVQTTCSDKVETSWVNSSLVFRSGDVYAPTKLTEFSTSTSTST